METLIWLFPIIFVFHNLEEIIGTKIWLNKNEVLLQKRFPKIAKMFKDFSTEGFAIATLEEFLLCIFLCSAVYFTNNL
ncbi:MAG: HXXEE domain-containing protein [Flavobacteriaceae bacterium]|nr:HXXEE domain-containing protein [Flavobacteriaceae bacterium]